MPTITKSLLRRYAQRSLEIHARHAQSSSVVAAFSTTLLPLAEGYIQAYEAALAAAAVRSSAVEDRTSAVAELGQRIRAWLPILRRDIKAVVNKGLGYANQVPEDMLADAKTIFDLVESHEADGSEPLSYKETLMAEITPLADEVRVGVQSTGGTRQEFVSLQAKAQELAEAFSRDLIAFRATLRAELGSSHPDYQALRVRGRGTARQDDELLANGEAASGPATAADSVANAPVVVADDDDDTEEVAVAS